MAIELNTKILELISTYKTLIEKPDMNDEVFKWHLLEKYHGKPDTSAPDFNAEIQSIKYDKLLYPMSGAVIKHLASTHPEELRKLFISLFDESKPLTDRIQEYINNVNELYRTVESKQSSHQDERTIATLLTFKCPDKYTFYKDSFYQEYCKYLGIKPKDVGKKYIHYLELINDLIENYIKPDSELVGKMESLLPDDAFKDTNYMLLAQDIIYQTQEREMKTKQDGIYTWVKTHKGITEYLRPMREKQTELIELLEKAGVTEFNDKDSNGYTIRLTEIDPFTFFFYIYKYGDDKQLRILQNLAKLLGITVPTDTHGLPSTDARNVWIFPYKRERTNNEINRLWDFFDSAMNDKITDPQFADILKIKGVGKPKLTTALFHINPEKYLTLNKQTLPYLENKLGLNPDFKNYSDYSSLLEKIREKNSAPFYEISHKAWIWNTQETDSPINPDIQDETDTPPKPSLKTSSYPLNQILYGPPGTGKTYNTVNKALEILSIKTNGQTRAKIKELFDDKINEGQIVFTTFHQSMSYEDFIEGIKPLKPDENDGFLSYDTMSGVFKTICGNAKQIQALKTNVDWDHINYYKMSLGGKNRSDIHDWCIKNNVISIGWGGQENLTEFAQIKSWEEYRDKFTEAYPELVKESRFNIQGIYWFQYMNENDVVIVSKGNREIDAIGIVKGPYYWNDNMPIDYVHFRKVEWIAKNMNSSTERFLRKQISQMTIYGFDRDVIKKEAFEELTSSSNTLPKPYVLIIDEINRGNVAQIFGELITLIEEDKRLGNPEALEVTLPYSKEKFGVPPNLYIIGTMNTADRSIEALDTALRRRFCFEEITPKYDLVELDKEVAGFKLCELLRKINERIEKLIDKDHMIGHSYFMSVKDEKDLKAVFQNKVNPLLQEYFFGDFGKIGLVLGAGFFEHEGMQNNETQVRFALFNDYDDEELSNRPVYRLKNVMDMSDTEFSEAIATLMR